MKLQEKIKNRIRAKKWAKENPERVRENGIRWRNENRERLRAQGRKNMAMWRKLNPDKAREQRRGYCNRRWKRDPEFRLLTSVRSRIFKLLKGNKSEATLDFLGCNIGELKAWLSGWFEPGMTWENYGRVWQLDHHFPCASFNLYVREDRRRCFHYLNLRPLFSSDNLSKKAKIPS